MSTNPSRWLINDGTKANEVMESGRPNIINFTRILSLVFAAKTFETELRYKGLRYLESLFGRSQ